MTDQTTEVEGRPETAFPAHSEFGDLGDQQDWLLCRSRAHLFGLPLSHVSEIMRVLPIDAVFGAPPYVRGLCVIRGVVVPVVDSGLLLSGHAHARSGGHDHLRRTHVLGSDSGARPSAQGTVYRSAQLCARPTSGQGVCLRLLLVDEFNAGSHYVLALCRDQAGFPERAIEHDRVASYLAPAFAMPRLHAGLLAHRAGNRDTARRELRQALDLLKREDASRLLLFGGGFTREVLMALCESALEEMGAGRE